MARPRDGNGGGDRPGTADASTPRDNRKLIHRAFEVSLLLKGLFALAETISGIGLMLPAPGTILNWARWVTHAELSEDPSDRISAFLLRHAQNFSIETQHFWAWYLIGHGVLKLAVVLALFRGYSWAYPAGIVVMAGFIVWQTQHWMQTHSPMLLAFTAFDVVVVWLIWREWRNLPPQEPA
ncbi:DUF2127 domain-containing protein [Paracoccus pacificus]|uniref:DUF2127 domain-containing protein n=1 Tax=Paracoccus pacificus TaxID=1463598 RepID=A0ABW4R3W1_9RHOB